MFALPLPLSKVTACWIGYQVIVHYKVSTVAIDLTAITVADWGVNFRSLYRTWQVSDLRMLVNALRDFCEEPLPAAVQEARNLRQLEEAFLQALDQLPVLRLDWQRSFLGEYLRRSRQPEEITKLPSLASLPEHMKVQKLIYEKNGSKVWRLFSASEKKYYVLKEEEDTAVQKIVARLQKVNHPAILLPISYADTEDDAWQLMEDGGVSLTDLQIARGNFSSATVAWIALQVLDFLEHLHGTGYCGLDMKGDNILLSAREDGRTQALTFIDMNLNIWKIGTEVLGEIYWYPGTFTMLFPSVELLRGKNPFPRDDVEMLGYMLVYLAHGSLPWAAMSEELHSVDVDAFYEVELPRWEDLPEGTPFPSPYAPLADFIVSIPNEILTDIPWLAEALRITRSGHIPDYQALRTIFRSAMVEQSILDWDLPQTAQPLTSNK